MHHQSIELPNRKTQLKCTTNVLYTTSPASLFTPPIALLLLHMSCVHAKDT